MAIYWALRFAGWVLALAPLSMSYRVARVVGVAVFTVWRGGRRRCIGNMRHVTEGDAKLALRHARSSFAYYATYLVDFLRFGALSADELCRRIDFDDWAVFDEAREGDGVVFVTVHFGNWDLAAARISHHGLPLAVVADTFDHAGLNDLVVGTRERLGMHIIPSRRMGPGILRALRGNEIVALLMDVPQAGAGVEVEFFGAAVAVPDGPARLALRTGASIVAGVLPRLGPTSERFQGEVERVSFSPGGEREQDVRDLTQAMMRSLERMVSRHPDQWYIFRSLWVGDGEGERAA